MPRGKRPKIGDRTKAWAEGYCDGYGGAPTGDGVQRYAGSPTLVEFYLEGHATGVKAKE